MTRKPKSFGQKILAEGTINDRRLVETEITREAKELARKMPPDVGNKTTYVRNLVIKAASGELDLQVMKRFLQMTNTWQEAETCLPRVKLVLRKYS